MGGDGITGSCGLLFFTCCLFDAVDVEGVVDLVDWLLWVGFRAG